MFVNVTTGFIRNSLSTGITVKFMVVDTNFPNSNFHLATNHFIICNESCQLFSLNCLDYFLGNACNYPSLNNPGLSISCSLQ